MDLRNSPGVVGDAVTGARFVCTSCHVEMTDERPRQR
jgi:nitrate reductase cytochrome c-type subunit